MERAIATQHQAAYLAATAQRLKVPLDSPLLSRARLSRAERADIAAAVRGQLQYLDKFAAELAAGRLSPAQAAARANRATGVTLSIAGQPALVLLTLALVVVVFRFRRG